MKSDSITYSLAIGTCQDLSIYTGRTDCADSQYVRDNIQYLQVATKIITQFFDPKLGLQTTRTYTANTLNAASYIKKRVLVTQVRAKAYTSLIYNYPLSDGTPYTYYNTEHDDTEFLNQTVAAAYNNNFLFSLNLAQNEVYFKQSFTTLTLFALLASFGGFLSLVRLLSNTAVKDIQNFSLQNSMIKKLFTKMTE